jgi:hypothetical protein
VNGERYQVASDLFSSVPRFTKWCNGNGFEWTGALADLAGVFDLLNHPKEPVPSRRGVSVVGLHRTDTGYTWVTPNEVFGHDPDSIVYVPSTSADPHWIKGINLTKDDAWELEAIELLTQLHDPRVITPLLGWVAAAPLRSLCPKFPPLVVTGGSGYGKSTTLETVLRVFGFWTTSARSLGSATPYIVEVACGSSNALPVWFDEYRGSRFGRDTTRHAIQQAIRDSYDGASTDKGGGREAHLGVISMPMIAPLIVSGEDSLTEVSHIERALIINLPKQGKNPHALAALLEHNQDGFPELWAQGFGRDYLEWLIELPSERLQPPFEVDRKKLSVKVARWGYGLLCQFMQDQNPDVVLPRFDPSQVTRDQREALSANPIADALNETFDIDDTDGAITFEDDEGYMNCRVTALVEWVRRNRADSIVLPGGASAIKKWLLQECPDAEYVQVKNPSSLKYQWVVRWPMPAEGTTNAK